MTCIVNLSLSSGIFLKEFKYADVKPLLKKLTLDSTDLKNYRLISNLCFLSKLVECIIANRLLTHLSSHDLLAKFQSAYHKFHSSETVLLYVQNDILLPLKLVILLHFSNWISLLLLTILTIISKFIVYNIGSVFHTLLLLYYPFFFLIVIKLSLLPIPNRNQFCLNMAFHKGACWDPYSTLYPLLHSSLLYLSILEFIVIFMLMTP